MMKTHVLLLSFFCAFSLQQASAIDFVKNDAEKKIDVMVDGKLFTSYVYSEAYYKPVLYPVNAPNGITVTRGFPVHPQPGERADHPHHVGIWFNHGNVNGLDFWNNSDAIPADKKPLYGTIRHKAIVSMKNNIRNYGLDIAELQTTSEWVDYNNHVLINEETTYDFVQRDNFWGIIRITKLTAADQPVAFKDSKEGLLGFRFCREFEDPNDVPKQLLNDQLVLTDTVLADNHIATGVYENNDGLKKANVWGKPSKWISLTGTKDNHMISMAICDHQDNLGYPAHSHARGYGLFAINNMGSSEYGDSKKFEYTLQPQQSLTFKHLFLIKADDTLSKDEMDSIFNYFNSYY